MNRQFLPRKTVQGARVLDLDGKHGENNIRLERMLQ